MLLKTRLSGLPKMASCRETQDTFDPADLPVAAGYAFIAPVPNLQKMPGKASFYLAKFT